MLHNNKYEILRHYLGDYNQAIYGRNLIGKVSLSQKAIAIALNKLEKGGILRSKKQGNIKFFSLNTDNPEIKDIILSLEITKKLEFLKKHRKITNIFKTDDRIVGIFGSYAKSIETKDSDIDIFIIGNKLKEDYGKRGKLFDMKISIKYFSEKDFINLVKNKNSLVKEIIKDHILIFGLENFINTIWSNHYGFN